MSRLWSRVSFLALIILFTTLHLVYAESNLLKSKQVEIQADSIEFDQKTGSFTASKNTIIKFDTYKIFTDFLHYNTNSEETIVSGNVKIFQNNYSLFADKIIYNYANFAGQATNIKASIEGTHITGQSMAIRPEQVDIIKASFTTCSLPHPHYLIKTDHMILYPFWGTIVTVNDFLLINNIPVFYFPSYIYGSRALNILGATSPAPEIGASTVEGVFIKTRYGYALNKYNMGAVTLGYAENLGLLSGISHSIPFDQSNNITLVLNYSGNAGIQAGFHYTHQLVEELVSTQNIFGFSTLLKSAFIKPEKAEGALEFNYTYRNLIKDYWVSQVPVAGVRLSNWNLPLLDLQLSSSVNFGKIIEVDPGESTGREQIRTHFDSSIKKTYSLSKNLTLITDITYIGNWYNNYPSWQKALFTIEAKYTFNNFIPGISFTRKLFYSGNSSFHFESDNEIENDELSGYLNFIGNKNNLHLSAFYNLENNDFRAVNIQTILSFHCWQTSFIWETLQGTIKLEISLK